VSPDLAAAALVDELSAIACPVDRAAQAARVAKWLRPVLTRIRWGAVREARATNSVVKLSADLGVTPGRLYQGLTETKPGPTAVAVDPAPTCAAPSMLPPAGEPAESARSCKTVEGADPNVTVATAQGVPS